MAVACATLTVVGCDGDAAEGPAAPTVARDARETFIARSDRACAARAPLREEEIEDFEQAGGVARAQLSAQATLDTELRRIGPPPELIGDVQAYRLETGKVIRLLQQEILVAEAPGGGTDAAIERFNRLASAVGRTLAERQAIAERIGFRVCGRPGQGPPLSSPSGG